GLELETDGQSVGLALRARVFLGARDPVGDAQEVLDVVADLVRDHVGLGEVAGRAEAAGHLVEEREVEVDLAGRRAIERPDRGRRHAARRVHGAVEEDELRRRVTLARLLEDGGPGVFGAAEDLGREVAQAVVGGRLVGRPGLRGRLPPAALQELEDLHRILAGEDRDPEHQAQAATADPGPPAHAHPAAILDVVAPALALEAHDVSSREPAIRASGWPIRIIGRVAAARKHRMRLAGGRPATLSYLSAGGCRLEYVWHGPGPDAA